MCSFGLQQQSVRRLARPKPLSSGFRPNMQCRHVLRDESETVSLNFTGRTHRVILCEPPACNNSFWTKLLLHWTVCVLQRDVPVEPLAQPLGSVAIALFCCCLPCLAR